MNKYEAVIEATSGLIYMIISKYFKGYDKEDLYQVGTIGVIKAYNNYQKNSEAKFSTYAYKYIYGEIYTYINYDKSLKISRENYVLYKKINEVKNILSQKLMKEPNIIELSSFLEIEPNIISSIYNSMQPIDSLDRTIYSDGRDVYLSDTLKDKTDYYNADHFMLNEELEKLSAEEKKIIYLRYYQDKTQSEVAKILGMNQVQVSRNEKKTLTHIKKKYENVA